MSGIKFSFNCTDCCIAANADIYFDSSLSRLNVRNNSLQAERSVLSLLKWSDYGHSIQLSLRTDSQDAWLFQSPIDEAVVAQSGFAMGVPRCDNRLAHILRSSNYSVRNPAFALRAIELQTARRAGALYGMKDAVQGAGQNVLLSDQFVF